MKLALTIIQAGSLPLRTNGDQPYTYITGKMLFEDRGFDMFETKVIHSSNPVYNETFVFHEVEAVDRLLLEIFIWDKKQYHTNYINNNNTDESDEFLGMIQLPLNEANLEDEPRWYELRDRQTRKPSTTSVTFKSSSIESGDSIRKMPPLLTNNNNNNKSTERTKPLTTDLLMRALNRSTITNKIESNKKTSTIPSIIMTNIDVDDNNDDEQSRRTSTITVQSVKLKRRISKGILKFFDINTRRSSETISKSAPSSPQTLTATRKSSSQIPTINDSEDDIDIPVGLALENTTVIINKSPRHSIISTTHADDQQQQQQNLIRPIPLQQMPIGQLMLPYIPSSRHSSISGSRKSSAASYIDSDDDIDRYFTLSEQQQEENNENNNVQTHMVGPGQVTPRNYENMINDYIYMGQIQLGLIVTKGLLEIDVICARGLERVIEEPNPSRNENNLPDTYVKT